MTNTELKSKVMTLGNRLAPRMGGDRRAAFTEAWAIVKAGGLKWPSGVFPSGIGRKPCAVPHTSYAVSLRGRRGGFCGGFCCKVVKSL